MGDISSAHAVEREEIEEAEPIQDDGVENEGEAAAAAACAAASAAVTGTQHA